MKRYRISARHFRQNCHFLKGPFAISFAFLFIVWRFRQLSAISAIFATYAIFAEITTFQRAPLPSHLNFCLQFGDFGNEAPFLPFSPNTPFSPKSPPPKGPFAISFEFLFTVWRFWRLSAISAIFAKYAIFAKIATFQRAPLPSHLNFCLQFGDFGD